MSSFVAPSFENTDLMGKITHLYCLSNKTLFQTSNNNKNTLMRENFILQKNVTY